MAERRNRIYLSAFLISEKWIPGERAFDMEGRKMMQTFVNTGIKMEVIDEIISFAKKYNIHRVIMSF